MFSFFKSSSTIEFKSPVTGRACELSQVPDSVFSSKIMGDGIALEPSAGTLYSPVNGIITNVFPTKHALGIVTDRGVEVLLHVGIDTVELMGQGFKSFVEENDRVCAGDKLISFDMEFIKEKGKPLITPMLITNMDMIESIDYKYGDVDNNSVVMVVRIK